MLSTKELRRSVKKKPKVGRIWRWLRFVLVGLFAGVFIYSGIHIGGYFIEGSSELKSLEAVQQVYAAALEGDASAPAQSEVSQAQDDDASLQAYEALVRINGDAVGWLTIPGTDIDHPFVQTTDNTYYLKRNFKGERSARGCVFMDARNSLNDRHVVLYGHRMQDGSMFGTLPLYQDEDYYALHPDLTINLKGVMSHWKIFSIHTADDSVMQVRFADDEEFKVFLDGIKKASLYDTGVDVSADDTLLTLSTCGDASRERFVIHAKKVD